MSVKLYIILEFPERNLDWVSSEDFNLFLQRYTGVCNSELGQFEQLFGIDFSCLNQIAHELTLPDRLEEYHNLLTMNTEYATAAAMEIRQHFLKNAPIQDTWIPLKRFRTIFKELKDCIVNEPNYHQFIQSDYDWGSYFDTIRIVYDELEYPIADPLYLLEDLFMLDKYLTKAMGLGHHHLMLWEA